MVPLCWSPCSLLVVYPMLRWIACWCWSVLYVPSKQGRPHPSITSIHGLVTSGIACIPNFPQHGLVLDVPWGNVLLQDFSLSPLGLSTQEEPSPWYWKWVQFSRSVQSSEALLLVEHPKNHPKYYANSVIQVFAAAAGAISLLFENSWYRWIFPPQKWHPISP